MVYKIPETITEEELIKILEATKKPHHKFAFALGFYEAMRISEIVKLNPEDIDKQTKLIHIREAKGHKDRMIPISPEIIKGLKHIPIKCGIRALEIKFKIIAKQTLNKDLHFHCLRHSGITHYLVKKKWSSLEVQRLAGHSRITTTELYSHIRPEDLVNRMWD
jgi:integrase